MNESEEIEVMARKLKSEQSKKWARKNKDKVREINKRYWLKRAQKVLDERKKEMEEE